MCRSGVAVHLPDVLGWFHMRSPLTIHRSLRTVYDLACARATEHSAIGERALDTQIDFNLCLFLVSSHSHSVHLHLHRIQWPIKISRANEFDELSQKSKYWLRAKDEVYLLSDPCESVKSNYYIIFCCQSIELRLICFENFVNTDTGEKCWSCCINREHFKW